MRDSVVKTDDRGGSLHFSGLSTGSSIYRQALSSSRFGTHVAVTMATNLLVGVLTIGTGVLVARLLGPSGRGELAAIQSWAAFIATVALLGLPEAVVYFSAQDRERTGHWWIPAGAIAIVAGMPLLLVGGWLMPLLLAAQAPEVVSNARWYLVGLFPLFVFHWMPLAVLRGRGDLGIWNLLQSLPSIGWLCVLVLFWAVGHATVYSVSLGYLVSLALLGLPVTVVTLRRLDGRVRFDPHSWIPMLRYALPLGIVTVLQQLSAYGRLAQMFMAAWLEPDSLGLFAVALAWGNATGSLTQAVGVVLFPDIASRHTDIERADALARGVRVSVLLTAGLSAALMLAAPLAVPAAFGREFAAAVPAAMIMVAGGAIGQIKGALDQGLRGLGKPRTVLVGELIGLAMTALLLALLLPPLNTLGAATATLFGYVGTAVYLTVHARRLTGLSVVALLWPRWADVVMIWHKVTNVLSMQKSLQRR